MNSPNIKLDLSNCTNRSVSTDVILVETGEPIGSAEGYIGANNQLVFVLKVNQEYRGSGIGYNAFKQVFDCLSKQQEIECIVGTWSKDNEFSYCEEGKSTNLLIFQQGAEKGMTDIEAALNTPTGKWAARLGYNDVKVVRNTDHNVEVLFYRGE